MPTRRQRRVAELIHRELSLLLMFDARDPRLAGVTVTGVDVTPDLLRARIHFTTLGDATSKREALAGFEHATGFLRSELAGRLRLRLMPELIFSLDQSAEYGRRIDEVLDRLRASGRDQDESEPAPT